MRRIPSRADRIRTDAAAWNLWGWGGAKCIHFTKSDGIRDGDTGQKWDRLFSGLVLSAQRHLAAVPRDRGHYPTMVPTLYAYHRQEASLSGWIILNGSGWILISA